jgi:ABC-type branched-subunit amino acid transport system ATPase component
VQDLSKTFGGLSAVKNLSFCVSEGETVGLIGPNGAGKTTIFNLIMNEFRPDSGEIFFKGEAISRYPTHERVKLGIARTYQVPRPFSEMTVGENIRVGLLPDNLWKMVTEETDEALEIEIGRSVGFDDHQIAQQPSELAMGDLRRLELARTLAIQPSLLLLDEVFAGLTLGEIEQISELLVERKKYGLTYVMVSHDLRSMAPLVDRVIAVSFGEIITEGTFDEVVNNKIVQEAYLGQ